MYKYLVGNDYFEKKLYDNVKTDLEKELRINIYLKGFNISPNLISYDLYMENGMHVLIMRFEKFDCNLREYMNMNFESNNIDHKIDVVTNIMGQIEEIIKQLHLLNISHNDIKPENFLIRKYDNGGIKVFICDFGSSCLIKNVIINNSNNFSNKKWINLQYSNNFTNKNCGSNNYFGMDKVLGTNGYCAIEQLLQIKLDENLNFWALGCILIEFLFKISNPNVNSFPVLKGASSLNLNIPNNKYFCDENNENMNENINNKFGNNPKPKVHILKKCDPIYLIFNYMGYECLEEYIQYLNNNVNCKPILITELKNLYNYMKYMNSTGENEFPNFDTTNLNVLTLNNYLKQYLNLIPCKRSGKKTHIISKDYIYSFDNIKY